MPYSGFFRRALAFILDMLIVFIPTALFFAPMTAAQALIFNNAADSSLMQKGLFAATVFSWQIIFLVVSWLYFALLESGKKQSTWGKRLLCIKVVDEDGKRIGFAHATGRFFAKLISYFIFYIGFIMAGFTNRKRALHDMIASTYVVKKDFQEGQELPPTKSHWILLLVVCVLWLLFLLGGSLLSTRLMMTPTQLAAQTAAQRLTNLAQQGTRPNEPIRIDGAALYYTPEGHRAVVTDPVSNNKFTLFLQNGSNTVCCQAFPFGVCADTGFAECE